MLGLKKAAFNGRERRTSVVFDTFSLGNKAVAGGLCARESINCDCRDGVLRSGLGLRPYMLENSSVIAVVGKTVRQFFMADTALKEDDVGSKKLYCVTESGEVYGYERSTHSYSYVVKMNPNGKCLSIVDENGNKSLIFLAENGFYKRETTSWQWHPMANLTAAACVCKNRVFIGVKPATVAYSNPFLPADFTSETETAGKVRLAYNQGEIVALTVFQNAVYVFQEYGVARMDVDGLASEFKIQPLDYDGGEIYGGSVGVCGNSIFFLALDGVYRFDGKKFYRVAEDLKIAPKQIVKTCSGATCAGQYLLRYTDVDGYNRCVAVAADGKSGYFVSDKEGLSQCGGAALCRLQNIVYAVSDDGSTVPADGYRFTTQDTDFGVAGRKTLRKLRFEGEGSFHLDVFCDNAYKMSKILDFANGVVETDVLERGENFYFTFLLGKRTHIRKVTAEISVAETE